MHRQNRGSTVFLEEKRRPDLRLDIHLQANCCSAVTYVSIVSRVSLCDGSSWLGFATLDQFLTINEVRRPGKSLDAFGANGLVTTNAIAEAAIREPRQCLPHQPELRAPHRSLREQQLFLISRNCLVRNVTGIVGVAGKRLFHRARDLLLQFLFSLP